MEENYLVVYLITLFIMYLSLKIFLHLNKYKKSKLEVKTSLNIK